METSTLYLSFPDEKVKALAESTVTECKRQGFTVVEVAQFILCLQQALNKRRADLEKELFGAPPATRDFAEEFRDYEQSRRKLTYS